MTPAARIQAAIDILDTIHEGMPAEKALTGWSRRSRFAGSKDRVAVRDLVFQALRCWRSYACLGGAETGRGVMVGALKAEGEDPATIFTGQGYAPTPLTDQERQAGRDPAGDGERLDLPDWLVPLFRQSLAGQAEEAATKLKDRAPVMLRVNSRKTTSEKAISALKDDAIEAKSHPIARTALIAGAGARQLARSTAYRDGWVELQDGSSQAAMETLSIPDGSRVLDYCAGGGGKVLALAARCEASWFAHDALPQRLKDLPDRAARAGAGIVVADQAAVQAVAPYDLVLCDVPCSGTGTWRRSPDAKWRLTPERLQELMHLQAVILTEASRLVGPDGTLAYATCSLLHEENENQITAFLQAHPDWVLASGHRWPVSRGGDGFYIAQLKRKA